jgi:DNA primase
VAIPQDVIEDVRTRISLSDIIGERVTLKRSGRNQVGLCPFHPEKTPSFYVNDEEGYFHCFGCGKKGSVFDFVMDTRGFSFPEAVRFLAARAGIQVPEETGGVKREFAERRKALRAVVREAVLLYHETLQGDASAQAARGYFQSRSISEDTIKKFALGFAPERDVLVARLAERLKARGLKLFSSDADFRTALREVGIIHMRDDGSSYDSFRGRVIFPIARSDGSPVALGGRIITPSENRPKYINSCESPIYSKRKTFFGLSSAMAAMRHANEVFIVEGYMDVLSMLQCGYLNTLATCGTALTADHVLLLKRLVNRVVVVFDGDAAGVKAAASAFEVFINSGLDVSAVLLPDPEDPSSLAEKGGKEALQVHLEGQRIPAVDVYMRRLLEGNEDPSASAKGRAAEEVSRLLAKVTNPVEREALSERAAHHLGASIDSIRQIVREKKKPLRKPEPEAKEKVTATQEEQRYYRQMVVAVLSEPSLAASLLEMRTLTGEDAPLITARFPESVRGFLQEMANSRCDGVVYAVKNYARTQPEYQSVLSRLQRALFDHGLAERGLLEEALRQVTIGGGEPARTVKDAPMVAATQSLAQEVQQIRTAEAVTEDKGRQLQLAQEKLLHRRSLRQLQREKR